MRADASRVTTTLAAASREAAIRAAASRGYAYVDGKDLASATWYKRITDLRFLFEMDILNNQ